MEATKRPWHVNAITDGRIVGSFLTKADKYQINGTNNTIATVYHPADAAIIVAAVNSYDAHRTLVDAAGKALSVAEIDADDGELALQALPEIRAALRAALAAVEAAEKS
jgi:hypothetical protein